MLNKELPFLRIGFPLCSGVISGLFLQPGRLFIVIALSIIVSGFLISLKHNKRPENHIYGYTLYLALFLTGLLLYRNEKLSLSQLEQTRNTFMCTISGYAEERENSYRTIVRLHSGINENIVTSLNGSMLIYFRKDSAGIDFRPGDQIIISCSPYPIINRGNPCEFNYRFYMENHGIKYYCFADKADISEIIIPDHRKLRHKALIIRENIISIYRECGITPENLPLVAAITLGQKNLLEQEQKQLFMKAGIMHIMAVSGLHAGIVSMFIYYILFFMKGKLKIVRIIITILLLWVFAFITGLSPSVLRATLMFSFLHTGKLINRNANSINSVLASAFILILIHPSVIFDTGFLLSYSAVIFIICFYRGLYLKLNCSTWLGDKVWKSITVTILAQAGTLPLTIRAFNRFPTWFILSNLIIVPVASLLIMTGILIPVTYPVAIVSHALASILNFLTGFTMILTEKAAGLPFASIENIGMETIVSVMLVPVFFLLLLFVINKRNFMLKVPLYALLVLVVYGTLMHVNQKTTDELFVYNTTGDFAMGVRTGNKLNVYADTIPVPDEVLRHCATKRLTLQEHENLKNTCCIQAGEKRILVTDRLDDLLLKQSEADIIILRSKIPIIERDITFRKPLNALLVAPDVSSSFMIPPELLNSMADTIHFIKKSGSYRIRL